MTQSLSKFGLRIEPIDPPRGACSLNPRSAAIMQEYGVYFAVAFDHKLIKIGYAKDPWARLSSMQVGSPTELRMLAIIETYLPHELEGDLHAHFAKDRSHGEWFRFSGEMFDYAMKWGRAQWKDDDAA